MSPQEKTEILQQEWSRQNKLLSAPVLSPSSAQTGSKVIEQKENLPAEFSQSIALKAVDLPLSVLLKPISQATHHNIILGPGVEDRRLSIDVSNITIEHVLNTLLYSAGYGFRAKNNDLIILAQETRIFRIVLPPVNSQFNDVTSNESFVNSSSTTGSNSESNTQIKVGTKVVVQNTAEPVSFWDDVHSNLKTLISPTGQFSVNKPAGAVIITDSPSYLERIGQYFEDLNRRVTQQIEVDVKVVEVTLNNDYKFGVDWNILAENLKTFNSIGMTTNFASGNFTQGQHLTFNADGPKPGSGTTEGGFRLALNALTKQGKVEVVSQPRVTILNNQAAIIQVGTTQSFIDHSSFETTQTGVITSVSTSQVQEGVTMRLLGNIVGDQIYLSVTPVVTTIDNIRTIKSENTVIEAPQTTTKSINTLVKLNEGQTVAIGGLITSYVSKNRESIPVISKIPVLGKLFQFDERSKKKTELVIFITPKRG